MNQTEFYELLAHQGFPEPILVEYPANGSLDTHTHNFEALALVINGSMTIIIDGVKSDYSVGDVFHLKHQQPHQESYGPIGVKYLASRKDNFLK